MLPPFMIHEISNGIEENTQKFVQLALCDQFGKKYDQNNNTRIGMTDHYKPFLNDYKIIKPYAGKFKGKAGDNLIDWSLGHESLQKNGSVCKPFNRCSSFSDFFG